MTRSRCMAVCHDSEKASIQTILLGEDALCQKNTEAIPTLSKLLNYKEAAEILGLSDQTLRQWVSGEKIHFVKLGRAVRFTPEMINNMILKGVK